MAQRIGRRKLTLRAEAKLLERWIRAKASRAEHRIVAAGHAFANHGLIAPPLAAAKRQLQRVKKSLSALKRKKEFFARKDLFSGERLTAEEKTFWNAWSHGKKTAKKAKPASRKIPSIVLRLPKGLTYREVLQKAKKHVRDFRGFTYNARTGRAVAT